MFGEPVKVYCPSCGRKTGTYDGRATINHFSVCKTCKKLVIYDILTRKTYLDELPERATSSGMRFM